MLIANPLRLQVAPNNFAPSGLPKVAWSGYGELLSWIDIVDLELGSLPGHNANGIPLPNATFPDATARALRQHYYGAVSYADEQVGRVMTSLDSNGYTDNTVVVLFGDHGWQLGARRAPSCSLGSASRLTTSQGGVHRTGEHGEWAKHTDFDVATKTPLILRVPVSSKRAHSAPVA